MIVLGLFFTLFGVPADFLFSLKDYWHPLETVSTFSFILQDLFFVFVLAGAQIFAYPFVFKQKISQSINWKRIILATFIAALPVIVLTPFFGVNSVIAMAVGQIILAAYIWYQRPDLIRVSVFNFIYSSILAFVGIFILFKMYPSILETWWVLENLSGFYFAGIPLEEILWLGFTGVGFGLYPQYVLE